MRDGVPGIDYLDDNTAEALAEFPCMPARCADCAFPPGTGANLSPLTRRIAEECATERHAFWCHKSIKGEFVTILCAGWREAVIAQGIEAGTGETEGLDAQRESPVTK